MDTLEILKAIRTMDEAGDRAGVTLLAFVDGVGFESNAAGLGGVLENADEFCQFRTIWKGAAIAGSKVGRTTSVAIPQEEHGRFRLFALRFRCTLLDRGTPGRIPTGWIEAGDALMRVN
jgi:hypothetical protein